MFSPLKLRGVDGVSNRATPTPDACAGAVILVCSQFVPFHRCHRQPVEAMPLSPKLSAQQLADSFAEIAPRYSEQQALVESARCLFCFDAPCISACPTGIDIPAFIKKIASRNV